MRIAILTLDFGPQTGGVQTYLGEVAQRLARTHQVQVITPVAGSGVAEPFRRKVVRSTIPDFFWALRHWQPDRKELFVRDARWWI